MYSTQKHTVRSCRKLGAFQQISRQNKIDHLLLSISISIDYIRQQTVVLCRHRTTHCQPYHTFASCASYIHSSIRVLLKHQMTGGSKKSAFMSSLPSQNKRRRQTSLLRGGLVRIHSHTPSTVASSSAPKHQKHHEQTECVESHSKVDALRDEGGLHSTSSVGSHSTSAAYSTSSTRGKSKLKLKSQNKSSIDLNVGNNHSISRSAATAPTAGAGSGAVNNLESFFQSSKADEMESKCTNVVRKEVEEASSYNLLTMEAEQDAGTKYNITESKGCENAPSGEGARNENKDGKLHESESAKAKAIEKDDESTNASRNVSNTCPESLELLPPPIPPEELIVTTTAKDLSNPGISSASSVQPPLLHQIEFLVQQHAEKQVEEIKEAHRKELEAIQSLHNAELIALRDTTRSLTNQIKALQQKAKDDTSVEKIKTDLTNQVKSLQRQSASLQSTLEKVRSGYKIERQKNMRFKKMGAEINESGHFIWKPPGGGGVCLDSQSQMSDVDFGVNSAYNLDYSSGSRSSSSINGRNGEEDQSKVEKNNSNVPRSQESGVTTIAQNDGDEAAGKDHGQNNVAGDIATINAKCDDRHGAKESTCTSPQKRHILPVQETTQSPLLSPCPRSRSSSTSSREQRHRSSTHDVDMTVSLPPKRLDFQSALPNSSPHISQEPSPSSPIDPQFSIDVDCDNDSSSDDETRIQSSQNDADNDYNKDSPFESESEMRKVTPVTNPRDGNLSKHIKKKIPIRDVSNQIKVKEEKLSPVKRPSRTSWLDTNEGSKGGNKKAKHPTGPAPREVCSSATVPSISAISSSRVYSHGQRTHPPHSTTAQHTTSHSRNTASAGTNIATNHSTSNSTYKYHEVVRGRKEREQLHGRDCECCKGFYDAVLSGKGAEVFDRQKLIQENSRHRSRYAEVENTPKEFWELSFMDSMEERRVAAKGKEEDEDKNQMEKEEKVPFGNKYGEDSQSQTQSEFQSQSQGLSQGSAVEQSIAY